MATAITVKGVSKRYWIGPQTQHRTLIDTLKARGTSNRRRDKSSAFWALRDVSFEVEMGMSLGIVGQNGSGKSTLLKILSRISEPTSGEAGYRGRLSSLLEVGTGFHPQLSGRDNIFLSGAVLGMRRAEISRKLDQIVDFSGVEAFIDEPVKHYSSGMFVRLAFAVAAHLETEILLVDEVLAVGDLAFQRKCLERMDNVARQGRTILFVSHNLTAVRSLCKQAIFLKDGQITSAGTVDEVLATYYLDQWKPSSSTSAGASRNDVPSSLPVGVEDIQVRPVIGEIGSPIDTSCPFVIAWTYEVGAGVAMDQASILVHDENGLLILDQAPWDEIVTFAAGRYQTECIIPGKLFNNGSYFVSLSFLNRGETICEFPNAVRVDILDGQEGRHGWFGKWPGVIRPRLEWRTKQLS